MQPSYEGIIINHYKDPYETTSISWKASVSEVFFFVTQLDYDLMLLKNLVQ